MATNQSCVMNITMHLLKSLKTEMQEKSPLKMAIILIGFLKWCH